MSARSPRVVEARTQREASAHATAWAELYDRRLDDNLFLRPEFMLPLLGHACDDRSVLVVFVYDERNRMIGVAAFDETGDTATPFGGHTVSSCTHPLVFESTPVLDRDDADLAAELLWDWASAAERLWAFVRWERMRLDSCSWQAIAAAVDRAGARWWARRVVRRPALIVPDSWDRYMSDIGRSRRKRLRRIRRKIEHAGTMSVQLHRDDSDGVLGRFLRLEEAGWKGREGTALACSPGQERFFLEASRRLADGDAAYFLELLLDGRPVAITVNFLEGRRLYAYKGAYDPEHGRLSPGIAVEAELVRAVTDDDRVRIIDSCAGEEGHLAGLWGDRLTFGEIFCSTGAMSALSVGAAPHLRRSRQQVRRLWARVRVS